MVGLNASELPYEEFCAGDTIEYFSYAFVCGDPRGYRMARILAVDQCDIEFPIEVETIPLQMMLRRLRDYAGAQLSELAGQGHVSNPQKHEAV
ncbi:Set domain-containing hypothetical protein [Phytophthora megakarya]|uniref:Uncharacterized protein n=1 Tax=Phytophthora megakarya TaxID=4795 RepID=A0A225UCY6_9STRA|nr:Set domain-containing hypothetical protein [Phytophthora megakarya]